MSLCRSPLRLGTQVEALVGKESGRFGCELTLLPAIERAVRHFSAESLEVATFACGCSGYHPIAGSSPPQPRGVPGSGRGETICCDPAAFEDFLRRQAIDRNIAEALIVWGLTSGAVGSPIFPRRAER